jgi:hypothetical protein
MAAKPEVADTDAAHFRSLNAGCFAREHWHRGLSRCGPWHARFRAGWWRPARGQRGNRWCRCRCSRRGRAAGSSAGSGQASRKPSPHGRPQHQTPSYLMGETTERGSWMVPRYSPNNPRRILHCAFTKRSGFRTPALSTRSITLSLLLRSAPRALLEPTGPDQASTRARNWWISLRRSRLEIA